MKTFGDVGKKIGLTGDRLEVYLKFMKIRWADKETEHCASGFAEQWAERFLHKVELLTADKEDKAVLEFLGMTNDIYPKDEDVMTRKQIWEFRIEMTGTQDVEFPRRHQIIRFGVKEIDGIDQLIVWAFVDPTDQEKVKRTFLIYGTGEEISIDYKLRYCGTYQVKKGYEQEFVWHIFEKMT